MRIEHVAETEYVPSFRAAAVAGMFDVSPAPKLSQRWSIDLPVESRAWSVGLIVGPSGSGKTTIGRRAFGEDAYHRGFEWPERGSFLEGFPQGRDVKEITAALSHVGFSSPPDWLKPFGVLSNGQKFRAEMARLMLDPRELVVVDEFTSVIDRTVARIGSAAVSKYIRRLPGKQLVALSCHYDIVDWLNPDWVYDLADQTFAWRSLRRHPIDIEIARVHHSAWRMFAPHHYLSADLNHSATCFGAYFEGNLVAFDAWLPFVGRLKDERQAKRVHRMVCLPDYQGVGIGAALLQSGASLWAGLGYRVFMRSSHPAIVRGLARNFNWRASSFGRTAAREGGTPTSLQASRASNRITAAFEYAGPAMDRAEAERLKADKVAA